MKKNVTSSHFLDDLNTEFAESAKLEKAIQLNLRRLGYGR
jgi:hypothetical protein